ncbi:MAG: RNA-binding S4 domain-containing protein [Bacteroidia bacterium]|nr:RNA-binding S4 domain-containing protein [Bacteroidia bacterium]
MAKVRVDKWLWSVRIFKSRSIATKACREGKVYLNDKKVKPSTMVDLGYHLIVSKNGYNFEFEVLKLIDKRVGAPLAVECYTDHTPEEELHKYERWFIGKARPEFRDKGTGRPTKKDRRTLEDYKGEMYNFGED